MWKFQVVMSAIVCVVGLLILAFASPSADRSLYSGGQILAGLGGVFVDWFTFKRFVLGQTGD